MPVWLLACKKINKSSIIESKECFLFCTKRKTNSKKCKEKEGKFLNDFCIILMTNGMFFEKKVSFFEYSSKLYERVSIMSFFFSYILTKNSSQYRFILVDLFLITLKLFSLKKINSLIILLLIIKVYYIFFTNLLSFFVFFAN